MDMRRFHLFCAPRVFEHSPQNAQLDLWQDRHCGECYATVSFSRRSLQFCHVRVRIGQLPVVAIHNERIINNALVDGDQ